MADATDRKKHRKEEVLTLLPEAGQASTAIVLVALIVEGNEDEAVKLLGEIRDEEERADAYVRTIEFLLEPFDAVELARKFVRRMEQPGLKAISFAEIARHSHDPEDIFEACRNALGVKQQKEHVLTVQVIAQTIRMWSPGVVGRMREIITDPIARLLIQPSRDGTPILH
jgi:hypothetical protein